MVNSGSRVNRAMFSLLKYWLYLLVVASLIHRAVGAALAQGQFLSLINALLIYCIFKFLKAISYCSRSSLSQNINHEEFTRIGLVCPS